MISVIESFRATLRSLGWGNGLTYLLAQGLLRLSHDRIRIVRYHLVVQPIRDGIGIPAHRGRDIEVREAGPDDPLLARMDHPAAIITARFGQGARCLVALQKGELVGFLWWVEGAYLEDEVRCRFVPQPPGLAVWDFDVYICRRYRCGPAFSRLWDAASKRLFATGYRYTCSRISTFNPASLAAHRRLGARVVGKRLFICVGRMELTFSGKRPRMHVSFGERSRPEVRVGS